MAGGEKPRGRDLVGVPAVECAIAATPRFGTDLGGVLNKHNNDVPGDTSGWHLKAESAAPGAMQAITELVDLFGAANVFVISKLGASMRAQSEIWLHETMDVCGSTGLLRENIFFCEEIQGPHGKGPVAAKLGITHFVDDKDQALRAVFAEPAGNASAAIQHHSGQLFHFARSGVGQIPPEVQRWPLSERPSCVVPVANWTHLLEVINITTERPM